MKKLHEKGFPVPKPLYLSTDKDDEYFDTVFFIREYVEVCAMDNCIKPLLYIMRMYSTSDKNIIYCMYLCYSSVMHTCFQVRATLLT